MTGSVPGLTIDAEPPESRRRARLRSALGRRALVRTAEAAIGAVVFLALFQSALGFSLVDPAFWARFQRTFWQGFRGTLFYSAIAIPVSVAIGFLAGWARVSRYRFLSWPVGMYIDLIRGVPPIVLVIFAFLLIPSLLSSRFQSQEIALLFSALTLAVHSGAYQAEIFRAGFQSIPQGQVEAAHGVGLTGGQTMAHVVLPQTFRLSLPPMANEIATLLKDTSLLAALGAVELVAVGLEFNQQLIVFGGQLSWIFAVWTTIAAAYLALTFAITRGLLLVESWFRVPGMEGVAA